MKYVVKKVLMTGIEMSCIEVTGIIGKGAINGVTWNKRNLGYLASMAERLFLDPIGYGNELNYGYLVSGGGQKTPA